MSRILEHTIWGIFAGLAIGLATGFLIADEGICVPDVGTIYDGET